MPMNEIKIHLPTPTQPKERDRREFCTCGKELMGGNLLVPFERGASGQLKYRCGCGMETD